MTDHLALELRSTEIDETGTFEGFASVFNETDLVGDQVAPGAFRKSLAAHKRIRPHAVDVVVARPCRPRSAGGPTSARPPRAYVSKASCCSTSPGRARSTRCCARRWLTACRSAFDREVASAQRPAGCCRSCDLAEISLGHPAGARVSPGDRPSRATLAGVASLRRNLPCL